MTMYFSQIREVLDEMKLRSQKFVFVGSDFGGLVALNCAAERAAMFPDCVGVMTVCTAGLGLKRLLCRYRIRDASVSC